MKTKEQVIELLEQMAILLELRGENPFKVRAFANAARVLEGHSMDLEGLLKTGELEQLKGIGKGHIARIVREFYEKGKVSEFEQLRRAFPDGLFELFRIPGLGAKRIKALYEKLGIRSVGELEYACHENRLRDLEGFGLKSQENILRRIEQFKRSKGHFLVDVARRQSLEVMDYLKRQKGILKIEVAGSVRRFKETVKDIDILISARDAKKIHQAFVNYPEAVDIIAHGETKSSITLRCGMNCDLRTVTEEEFPYALYYFTGSKEHNVAIRTRAKKKGIKINEYGLFRGERRIPCRDEAEIFEKLGLHYIPPEVRENTGEIEFAEKHPFPSLVQEKDIRGVFHVHSDYSDGTATLAQMVAAAEKMGFEYIGISDHSQSAKYAHGLEPERLKQQWREIDQLRKKFRIRILKGIESDILADGSLDYPDALLKEFDFVIGSIHSHFTMPESQMMDRLCRAMENKYLTFIGHPTGRLLLGREGYAVNMPRLIDEAQKADVVIELNANPHRLDIDWRMLQYAKKKRLVTSVNPDAHSTEGLKDVTYGVGIARKGWLEKKDIVNTLPYPEVEKFLKRRR